MADNKNVSFENLKLLANLYNSGEVMKITQTVRNRKLEMETYCRDARAKQKEMLLISSVETKPNEDNTSKTIEEKKIVEPLKQSNNERIVNRQLDYNKNSFNKLKQSNNSSNSSNYSNSRTNQYNQQNQNRPSQSRFNNQKDKQSYNSNNKFSNQFNKDKKQLNSNKPNFLSKPVQKPKFDLPNVEIKREPPKKKQNERYEEKKSTNKRTLLRKGLIVDESLFDEDRDFTRKYRLKKKEEKKEVVQKHNGPAIITSDNVTVKTLSEAMGKPVSEIIKKFMLLNMMVTINSVIDFDTCELIANEMGVELQLKKSETGEEKLHKIEEHIKSYSKEESVERSPIVTVMGHVDHGKTSLLDYIRKTKVTEKEAGGITQHIGAYRVNVQGKSITFIDTPGHEAFTEMRARGAQVTDIAILVVAADDGIMPQTIEAINHIKAANCPMIVAINKMDKPQANPEKILTQLAEQGVLPEEWGGDAIVVKISALTGEGIDKLLETILLVAELSDLTCNPNVPAIGSIIEARLDKGKGAVSSVLVKDGTLHIGDTIVSGTSICKVKAMMDENGKRLKEAGPSCPVQVLGFDTVPVSGETFTVVDEKLSKEIVQERVAKLKNALANTTSANSLEDLIAKTSNNNVKVLNMILKADVTGSLQAIIQSIAKLNNDEIKVNILHSGVGAITESDVILAEASNAIIVAFNIKTDAKVKSSADKLKVKISEYNIIYDLLDNIERVMKGMKEPKFEEEYLGRAEIIMVFKLSSNGYVAGSSVKDGKIVRNAHCRILRDGEEIVKTTISSVKIVKDDVKEALKGRECGIKFQNFDEFKVGDIIECFNLKQIDL